MDRTDRIACGAKLKRAFQAADCREDIGIGHQKISQTPFQERMAKRQHLVAIDISDGAQRAETDIAPHQLDSHGAAWLQSAVCDARRRVARRDRSQFKRFQFSV